MWKPTLGCIYSRDKTTFCVWAPDRKRVVVETSQGTRVPLERDAQGYCRVQIQGLHPGDTYRYVLDNGHSFPDPCSSFQPGGPHGPSQIVDRHFSWRHTSWPGMTLANQVFYELHIGAFTPEGTFDAAIRHLPRLRSLGVTVLELMPIHEWAGRWNWGYDGVALFAPTHVYGDYSALKRFVDAAHGLNLGVVLDVVYNHFGPDGCYVRSFTPHYFTQRHRNDWGESLNFDGPHSREVRRFFIENACQWIGEFGLDGLRLDATDAMNDDSRPHVLADLSTAVRRAAVGRSVILVAENEKQDARCLTPVADGGFGLDGVWSDDFHHAVRVAVTHKNEAYYSDFKGKAQELVAVARNGYLYQGQHSRWQKAPRGTPTRSPKAHSFVFYTQNHDQVANSQKGDRLHQLISPAAYRAVTAFHLLLPQTPLLFMGQEYGETAPFQFFVDHPGELGDAVRKGRRKFLSQFPSLRKPEAQARLPDPTSEVSFQRSRLRGVRNSAQRSVWTLYRDLLALRKNDPVLKHASLNSLDGDILEETAFLIRWRGGRAGDRLLLINLGPAFSLTPGPSPLFAPPARRRWRLRWLSNRKSYGGSGVPPEVLTGRDLVPRESALFYESR